MFKKIGKLIRCLAKLVMMLLNSKKMIIRIKVETFRKKLNKTIAYYQKVHQQTWFPIFG